MRRHKTQELKELHKAWEAPETYKIPTALPVIIKHTDWNRDSPAHGDNLKTTQGTLEL